MVALHRPHSFVLVRTKITFTVMVSHADVIFIIRKSIFLCLIQSVLAKDLRPCIYHFRVNRLVLVRFELMLNWKNVIVLISNQGSKLISI